MKKSESAARAMRTSPTPCSAWVGKTVSDDILGRGRIIDETPSTVGIRFDKERRVMRVHYIPKAALTPNPKTDGRLARGGGNG